MSKLLFTAIENNHLQILVQLMSYRPNIDAKDNENESTVLYMSAERGYEMAVQMLVENGANVNDSNYEGESALLAAAKNGHLQICKYLIMKHADVNHRRENGDSILKIAKKTKNNNEVVKLL